MRQALDLEGASHDTVGELSFFTTAARFGTAADVTLAEPTIESFFPADAATDQRVRRAGASAG